VTPSGAGDVTQLSSKSGDRSSTRKQLRGEMPDGGSSIDPDNAEPFKLVQYLGANYVPDLDVEFMDAPRVRFGRILSGSENLHADSPAAPLSEPDVPDFHFGDTRGR
jgi:hypothetical protein